MNDAEKREVSTYFTVYDNRSGSGGAEWVYQPYDFDSTFELWSDVYATEAEADAAALEELRTADEPGGWEASKAAGPYADDHTPTRPRQVKEIRSDAADAANHAATGE